MNVIGSRPDGWWRDRPAAVRALVARLAAWQAARGERATVVFDGAPPPDLPPAPGLEVVFAPGPGRGAADDEITRQVAAEPHPETVTVVTSDAPLVRRVRDLGAAVVGAGGFRRSLEEQGTPPPPGAGDARIEGEMADLVLRSPAFSDHAPIPPRHSLDGGNVSPPLEWSRVPEGTVELAVLCEDPDAPGGTFVHWVLAGLDPSLSGLAEGEVPPGAVAGRNDYGRDGYGGPRPPVGDPAHRYFFRVYASSASLQLSPGASADDLRQALEGRELASGTIVGTYQR